MIAARRYPWGLLAALPVAASLFLSAAGGAAGAAEVRFFRLQSPQAFLAGTLDGISVDPLGTLRLADRADRLGDVGEPFVFAAAAHPEGWVLGTGNSGKVLLVDRKGGVTTLFTAPEPEIFAVWCDPDGTVYAGSSPGGKVYRIAGGEGAAYFDPEETYIWALARDGGGRLLVATGTRGRLFAVGEGGEGELLYDAEDTHLRSLHVLPGGDLLVGTAGEGLILRVDPGGAARTLYDARQPEVVAFAAAPDGGAYAAVLASEASLMDLEAGRRGERATAEGEEEDDEEGEPRVTVAVEAAVPGTAGSRPPGFRGARSELLRLSPGGMVESLWRFEEETVYSLLWHRDRLWVGTGLEGKLYSFRDRKLVLEKDIDERQVVALLDGRAGPVFATTNPAAVYRISDEKERRGSYTSAALDAGGIARFGTLRWQGEPGSGGQIRFSVRSGMSAEPDRTWSEWSAPREGAEIALEGVPAGRYLQWRMQLEATGRDSPAIGEVTVSYRQENLPPRITRLTVLDPGQILVPATFNPAQQVFEPAYPNRQGIFTSLEPAAMPGEERFKTVWLRGYRTLRWEAEDPNADSLVAELAFRPETEGADWLPIADGIEEKHFNFDATVLPDGVYRFRLLVSDSEANEPEAALAAEEISEPVLIDHTPPALLEVSRDGARLEVVVGDASSPLRSAELSVDAGEWRPVPAADGLLDGRRESFELEVPPDAKLVLLRVFDAAFNATTFDLSGRRRR